MSEKDFLSEMKMLSGVYGKEMNKEQALSWYMFLREFTIDDLKRATNKLATTCKYMPSLAEIRQEIVKSKNPVLSINAEDEWEEVRKAIRNFDIYDSDNALASLKPLTRRVLGMTCSWYELCTRPSEEVKWLKKDFIAIYNRELGKVEKIEMLGNNADTQDIEYKQRALEEVKRLNYE